MAADIVQLRDVAGAMRNSYAGVTGARSVTPRSNIMSASEVSLDQQTGVLEDIKELQQQQLRQSFLTNSFLFKSYQMEIDKLRRSKDQATEMKKELAKLSGAGAVAGTLGMGMSQAGGDTGTGGVTDLVGTAITTAGTVAGVKTVANAVTGGTGGKGGTGGTGGKGGGTKDVTDAAKTSKDVAKDAKAGKWSKVKGNLKLLAGNKWIKGTGLLTAILGVANVAAEFTDIKAAEASGDEKAIYEEKKDVAEAAGATGGALAGAVAGAAIGSVVPVVGTAIGGIIGGIVGSFGGAFLGEKAGGGLFDFFADSPEEKESKKALEESIKRRIPIKKRDLSGRGFNHRTVNTYWFDKGPDGVWYAYGNKKAKSPLLAVKDGELIDFLEGRISTLPNASEEAKKHNEDLKSNEPEKDVLETSTKTYDITQGKNPKEMTKDGLFLSGSGTAMASNLYANDTDYKSAAESSFSNDVLFKSEVEKYNRRQLEANTKEEAMKLLKEGEELVENDAFDGGGFMAVSKTKQKIGVFDKEIYVSAYELARNRLESYLDNAEKAGYYDKKNNKWKYKFAEKNFVKFIEDLNQAMSQKLIASGVTGDEWWRTHAVISEATKKAFYDIVPQGKDAVTTDTTSDSLMSPDDYFNEMIDMENKGGPSLMDKVKNFFGFGKKEDPNTELQKYAKTGVKMSNKQIDNQIRRMLEEQTGKPADEEQIKKMRENMKVNDDGSISFDGYFAQNRFLTKDEYKKYADLGGNTMEGMLDPDVQNYLKQVSPRSSDKIQSDVKKNNVDIDNMTPAAGITVNNQPINNTSTVKNNTTNTASLDTTQDPYKDKLMDMI